MRESKKEWRKNNRDKVREEKRRWYEKHKVEILARQKNKTEEQKQKKKIVNTEWKKKNKDKCRAYDQKRRALSESMLSPDIVSKLLKLQKGRCACCGELLNDDYHLDHIIPLSLGGKNEDSNIQLLKSKCNLVKNAKHPIEYMQSKGFLL